MSAAGTPADQHALVPLHERGRPAALYRIPFSLIAVGLFLIAVQAGQPVLGFAVMFTAIASTAAIAWRSLARRHEPALQLRDQGDAKLMRGRYAEARVLYERALAIVKRELPPAAPEVLLNYYSLAAVNSMLHDHARADQYLAELMRGLNYRVPVPWSGHVAWLLRRIAHHHSLHGRHTQAIDLCERALDLVGDAPGADDNTVRSLLDDLAWVHYHAGDYLTADRLFREALAVHERFRDAVRDYVQRPSRPVVHSPSPYREPGPATTATSGGLDRAVAYSLLGLGWTAYERGHYADAQSHFERASVVAAGTTDAFAIAESHVRVRTHSGLRVEILRGRAAVAMTLGDYATAESLYERAHQLTVEVSVEALQQAALQIDIAWLHRAVERFDEASAAYDRAKQQLADAPEGAATVRCALAEGRAELHRKRGRTRDAAREIGQAIALAERFLGPEHPRLSSILAVAARVHAARSDYGEAERCARQCLALLRARLGRTHPRFADGYVALGEVHLGRGQFGAAEQAFGRALEQREAVLGFEHPELVEILDGQAAVFRATMREDRAHEAEQRSAEIRDAAQRRACA